MADLLAPARPAWRSSLKSRTFWPEALTRTPRSALRARLGLSAPNSRLSPRFPPTIQPVGQCRFFWPMRLWRAVQPPIGSLPTIASTLGLRILARIATLAMAPLAFFLHLALSRRFWSHRASRSPSPTCLRKLCGLNGRLLSLAARSGRLRLSPLPLPSRVAGFERALNCRSATVSWRCADGCASLLGPLPPMGGHPERWAPCENGGGHALFQASASRFSGSWLLSAPRLRNIFWLRLLFYSFRPMPIPFLLSLFVYPERQ